MMKHFTQFDPAVLSDNWVVETKKQGKKFIKTEYLEQAMSFDIETSSFTANIDGKEEKLAYSYIWMFAIDDNVYYGRYLKEFAVFLDKIKEYLNLNKKRRIIIYVHNLSYEFQFINEYFNVTDLFATDRKTPLKTVLNNCFELKCSYILTNMGLAKLAERTRYNKMVGDLDYKKMRHSETVLTPEELGYCENDVLIVTDYINQQIVAERERYAKIADEKAKKTKKKGNQYKKGGILTIPLTSTGYVRRDYREYVAKECGSIGMYKLKYDAVISMSTETYTALKYTFSGGYTHANVANAGRMIPDVCSIDFTSSYPYTICSEHFPMSPFFKLRQIHNENDLKKLIKMGKAFMAKINMYSVEAIGSVTTISNSKCTATGKLHTGRLHRNSNGKFKKPAHQGVILDNGRIRKAGLVSEFYITDIDYKDIKLFYKFKNLEVLECYISNYGYLPKQLVETALRYYEGKTTLKGLPDRADEYQLLKALLNSLYGMCVTDPLNDEIIFIDELKEWEQLPADKEEAINQFNKNMNNVLAYCWGVWVTAHSRHHLLLGVHHMQDDYIYSDTDSIKFKNYEEHKDYIERYNAEIVRRAEKCLKYLNIPVSKLQPKDVKGRPHMLGVFDYEGTFDFFKTLGAKRYMTYSDGKLCITVAGINKEAFYKWLVIHLGEGKFVEASEKSEAHYYNKNLNTIKKVFELFNDGLVIPAKYSGHNIHYYGDLPYSLDVEDYTGKVSHVEASQYINIEESAYHLGVSDEYTTLMNKMYFQNYVKGNVFK